ncbi:MULTISPECIES: hypothetical protein [Pseudomonas]|uniref:Uncharacterized protein n=1 Tax=Pseudomonas shirazica TaxID=1940636 RepID=A0ABY9SNY9_9PSED|nr:MULTISPECIES: hypothetical protein [Pseudomonas]MBO2923493.1 hypothetical protein [Pseudomonas asiatica]MCO7538264.1 hypothetical protein [Pseudomonas asiatica]MCO7552160.1 hypothetical protein [Pseudomonas asiatica]MCO7563174.1 hypothetical protein [Pseudomonas asiatica]MDM9554247.1 hypothetical protein [Pseudomonas asiatica]
MSKQFCGLHSWQTVLGGGCFIFDPVSIQIESVFSIACHPAGDRGVAVLLCTMVKKQALIC